MALAILTLVVSLKGSLLPGTVARGLRPRGLSDPLGLLARRLALGSAGLRRCLAAGAGLRSLGGMALPSSKAISSESK